MGCRLGWMLALLSLLTSAPAWCEEDIVDVLRRSQDERLAAQWPSEPDSARGAVVRASFDRLLRALDRPPPAVALQLVRGPAVAETVHGHIIVANEDLAEMPEAVRLFILAHELGHVALQHWLQTARIYQKWVPGAVTPAHTQAVAALLGREASALSYEHEFAADAYAAHLLQTMGIEPEAMLAVFRHLGMMRDTATHPGTRKRLASLRALAMVSATN